MQTAPIIPTVTTGIAKLLFGVLQYKRVAEQEVVKLEKEEMQKLCLNT